MAAYRVRNPRQGRRTAAAQTDMRFDGIRITHPRISNHPGQAAAYCIDVLMSARIRLFLLG
jgi:hypothetical protein